MAQRFGFAGALVPGVEVFALASAPLVQAWGEAFLGGGRSGASATRTRSTPGRSTPGFC